MQSFAFQRTELDWTSVRVDQQRQDETKLLTAHWTFVWGSCWSSLYLAAPFTATDCSRKLWQSFL